MDFNKLLTPDTYPSKKEGGRIIMLERPEAALTRCYMELTM